MFPCLPLFKKKKFCLQHLRCTLCGMLLWKYSVVGRLLLREALAHLARMGLIEETSSSDSEDADVSDRTSSGAVPPSPTFPLSNVDGPSDPEDVEVLGGHGRGLGRGDAIPLSPDNIIHISNVRGRGRACIYLNTRGRAGPRPR